MFLFFLNSRTKGAAHAYDYIQEDGLALIFLIKDAHIKVKLKNANSAWHGEGLRTAVRRISNHKHTYTTLHVAAVHEITT